MIVSCEDWRPDIALSAPPSSLGLDLWQSPTGLRWVSGYLNARACLLRVNDSQGEAQLLVLLRKLPGGLSLASAYPYGHIHGEANLFWCNLASVRRALRKRGVVRLEIPLVAEYLTQIPATGLKAIRNSLDAVRHVVDLRAFDSANFEQAFDPNIRWAIRKAARNGVTIRDAEMDDVAIVQALYAQTMRAKGAPVNYGRQRWDGLLTRLAPLGNGRIYLAFAKDQPVGMAAVVDAALSRHLVQLAVPPSAHGLRAGELLVSSAMRDAFDSGKPYFDFMASSARDKGLIAFKAKWGSRAEAIRHIVLPVVPGLSEMIDVARRLNRLGARFRG